MAASAELLLSATAPLMPIQGERVEDGDPSKRVLAQSAVPDSGLEGSSSLDAVEAPLTSEPPLADVAPLTSEPPIGAELPLTSEPTGTALFSDGRGTAETAEF
ncbi:hypothetical protein [Streptomyces alkaliterrae]|uniref:Uncharacterized protein n=1 Tax=Streptomyces alkaliterrae TaxID=2213162 RepID=A0A5P0YKY7_9ACTN|nr:hypothetical protein [Streptomyces alkaliterrae]MBB1253093.1 hypothetical protein [Streptomyces alkaliterrae]MBB1259634.1 hypothetical protein [Streptomyces alkaliterrae]MQS00966.1 hypothetical protein [Streptomyces alkaliterrae]